MFIVTEYAALKRKSQMQQMAISATYFLIFQ